MLVRASWGGGGRRRRRRGRRRKRRKEEEKEKEGRERSDSVLSMGWGQVTVEWDGDKLQW
jgi:hypothetical protein